MACLGRKSALSQSYVNISKRSQGAVNFIVHIKLTCSRVASVQKAWIVNLQKWFLFEKYKPGCLYIHAFTEMLKSLGCVTFLLATTKNGKM